MSEEKKIERSELEEQVAELKESVDMLKKFQQGYIDRIIALEERLKGVDPSVCIVDKVKGQIAMKKEIEKLKIMRVNNK